MLRPRPAKQRSEPDQATRYLSGNWDFRITPGHGGIHGLGHAFNNTLDTRPTGGGQHHNGNFAARKILLITEILVGRNQHGKTGRLGLLQQITVSQCAPAKLEGRNNLMVGEVLANRDRSALVEKDAHLRRF